MTDARFEDGQDAALHLTALDAADLTVISSLIQDAVFPVADMTWQRPRRRFAMLLNRFRWEDQTAAEKTGRAFERVRTLLVIKDVAKVITTGLNRADPARVLSFLSISFEAGFDGTGQVRLVMAGGGEVALHVECLDVTLKDVTRPYAALSGAQPRHPETD